MFTNFFTTVLDRDFFFFFHSRKKNYERFRNVYALEYNKRSKEKCARSMWFGSPVETLELVFELTALDSRVAYEWFGSWMDEHVSL